MGTFLAPSDFTVLAPDLSTEKAEILISDVEAKAAVDAPCILEPGFPYAEAVTAILRQAVLRWHDAGNGGKVTEQNSAGPFGKSITYDKSAGMGRLWPSEVRELQALCRRFRQQLGGRRKAFTILPGGRRR